MGSTGKGMSRALILIVEDNREMRSFLEDSILKPAGYSVLSAEDGLVALAMARKASPDLVITDQQMPGMQGIELIRSLRDEDPSLPVILMTSEGSEELAAEAVRAGAFDYLVKPFEADRLLESVQRGVSKEPRPAALQKRELTADDTLALRRRIEELETLALIGRTVTSSLDLDTVLVAVVDAAVRLTGAEEGSLLMLDEQSDVLYMRASKNFDEQFAKAFRLRVNDSLAGQVIKSGKPVLLEEGTLRKIKTSYLVHSLIYVPLMVRGRTLGVLGVDHRTSGGVLASHDITVMEALAAYAGIAIENAQLYENTEAERSKLEEVLSRTENGVILIDEADKILMINRNAQHALGVSAASVGRPFEEELRDPGLLALLSAGGMQPLRDELEMPDGRVFSAQRTTIPGVGHVVVMHDITHLKELDKVKSEFVTTVSHDLRSPLTAILGYVDLMERAGPINGQQKEFLSRVRESVNRITGLVNDLLDLGRIEAGFDMAKDELDLAALCSKAVESMRAAAEAKGLTIGMRVAHKLPPVLGDEVRLRQMLRNLLDNAIKYTPPGGEVLVEADASGDQVILHVIDSGCGIPPADQPHLFDKFFRGSNVPPGEGSGLGLSIVKSIVDNHRGRVWVESAPGEGSRFTVVLPAMDA
jgi:two-component system phosphate regulon sensor histidine kinase PhoR